MKHDRSGSFAGPVLRSIEETIGPVIDFRPVSGGSISRAFRVETSQRPLFVKIEANARSGFFDAEAAGLQALRSAASLRLPEVVAVAATAEVSWIALEWLESEPPRRDFGERLGRGLAEVHAVRGVGWGWYRDGFIGSLPQANDERATWAEFWRQQRLEPQLQLARSTSITRLEREWNALREALPYLLEPIQREGPSLLHGDLWSGNVMSSQDGPALVDPACYFGHREVDLAMADLFGGFGRGFREAYEAEWPLEPGYEVRLLVYQLYYLLVHVNLFGGSYLASTEHTLRQILIRT